MAININIPIEDAVTDGSLNPVTSNAVFDALAGLAVSDLQSVTDVGNTTTNDIAFIDTAGILLENTSRLREGTIDAQTGGYKGIAQICAVGYELKWEAGSQYVMDGNGTLVREVNHKFNIVPDLNNDSTQGFYVGSRWILDDGDIYICTDSTATNAVWEKLNSLDELVPYNGATADVNLGNQDLYANKVWLYDAPNDAYGSIHLTDNDFHIEDSEGHKMLVIEDGFMQIHLTDAIQSNLFTSGLTQSRDHYLPDASGTIALTSNIPAVDSVPTDASANAVSSNGVFDALALKAPLTPRVQSVTSSATVTPTSTNDFVKITAQAVGLTLANPTGTWDEGKDLIIRIKDNGTARSIAYGTKYRVIGVTLPTTTVVSKTTYLGLIYNATDDTFDVVGVTTQA